MVHRKEFEADREPEEVGRGQVIRVRLHTEVSDSTGFVLQVENGYVFIGYISGIAEGRIVNFKISEIATVCEVMSSPTQCKCRASGIVFRKTDTVPGCHPPQQFSESCTVVRIHPG